MTSSRHNGFTLLELVISCAIVVTIFALATTTLTRVHRLRAESESQTRLMTEGRALLDDLADQLYLVADVLLVVAEHFAIVEIAVIGVGVRLRRLGRLRLRSRIPGLVIRTSIITGLPGEGEAEFEELCAFLRRARLERAGVFPFSPEEGTPAAKMPHCDEEEARRRADLIMELQAPIMDEFCQSFVGRTIPVLVTDYDEEEQCWVGRSYADSPDIDGEVRFDAVCREDDMVQVRIRAAEDGILYGEEG